MTSVITEGVDRHLGVIDINRISDHVMPTDSYENIDLAIIGFDIMQPSYDTPRVIKLGHIGIAEIIKRDEYAIDFPFLTRSLIRNDDEGKKRVKRVMSLIQPLSGEYSDTIIGVQHPYGNKNFLSVKPIEVKEFKMYFSPFIRKALSHTLR